MTANISKPRALRPETRNGFEIAIICALTLEADAVEALFDIHWDDDSGLPFDKAPGDPNAYSTGAIGRHNVVLAYMPAMGKVNAAAVASNCQASFPSIRLALVVGVYGVIPFMSTGEEIVLGDVIISDGVIQYDLGRRLPGQFERKDTLLDSLGRPSASIRSMLSKLKGLRSRKQLATSIASYLKVLQREPLLAAEYPGTSNDQLFEPTYRHGNQRILCDQMGCDGQLVARRRLQDAVDSVKPVVYFGLIASGDSVMKSGEDRDAVAAEDGVIAFEMEGAGIWDSLPCLVIKGACDYADSHKSKKWQRYAAATAASCMKALLSHWMPSLPSTPSTSPDPNKESPRLGTPTGTVDVPCGPWFIVPHPRNENFIGRDDILKRVKRSLVPSASQSRTALVGLVGIGLVGTTQVRRLFADAHRKTEIALEYAHWLRDESPEVSVFWVTAGSAEQFRQSYSAIARECQIPGYSAGDPKTDVVAMVKTWLAAVRRGRWLMIVDNADDDEVFYPPHEDEDALKRSRAAGLTPFIPKNPRGSILFTSANKQVGSLLAKGREIIEVERMSQDDTDRLVRTTLNGVEATADEVSVLSSVLGFIPSALTHATSYIRMHSLSVTRYLQLLKETNDQMGFLSKGCSVVGNGSQVSQPFKARWHTTLQTLKKQNAYSADLLSVMCFFYDKSIPIALLSCYQEQQHDGPPQGDQQQASQLEESLGVLRAFSFIETDENTKSLSLNRFATMATMTWLRIDEDLLHHFLKEALVAVCFLYPFPDEDIDKKCTTYLPHVDTALGLHLPVYQGEKWLANAYLARATLLTKKAVFFCGLHRYKDGNQCFSEAISTAKDVLGEDHFMVHSALLDWARELLEQGEIIQAQKHQEYVLEKKRQDLGTDDPSTQRAMTQLATSLARQGREHDAEKLLVECLELMRETQGGNHLETLRTMTLLAHLYERQGRCEKAKTLQEQAVDKISRKFGKDHVETLQANHRMACIFHAQGSFQEAEALWAQILEVKKRIFGEEHRSTLETMASLSWMLLEQCRYEEFEVFEMNLKQKLEQVLGENDKETLDSLGRLVLSFWRQDQPERSMELGEELLEKRRRVLGEHHHDTLKIMITMAGRYAREKKQLQKAEALYVEILGLRKQVLGETHPFTLETMESLLRVYSQQGQRGEEKSLQAEIKRIKKEKKGSNTSNGSGRVKRWKGLFRKN